MNKLSYNGLRPDGTDLKYMDDKEMNKLTSPIGSMLNRCFKHLFRKFELIEVRPDGFHLTAKSTLDGKTYNVKFKDTVLFANMGGQWMRVGSIEQHHKMIGVSRR